MTSMDESNKNNGQFVAGEVQIGNLPSPWLRLAHECGYDGKHPKEAHQRQLLDHEFIFQLNGGWLAGF